MTTVLLADDDQGVRTMLSIVLGTAGFEVAAHQDGESALQDALHRVPTSRCWTCRCPACPAST
jgi:CheY-like chemotaxis protein